MKRLSGALCLGAAVSCAALACPPGGATHALARGGGTGNIWTAGAALPTGVMQAATGAIGNRVYVVGGSYGPATSRTFPTSNQAYDTTTNSWSSRAPIPTARAYAAAAVGTDGAGRTLLYVIGGYTQDWSAGTTTWIGANEAYDPNTDSWTTEAPMPTPRWGAAVGKASNGLIYVAGGGTAAGDSAVVEAYNPATNTWTCSTNDTAPGCSSTALAPLPQPVVKAAGASDGASVYVEGGETISGTALVYLDTNYIYNTNTNSWTTGRPLPVTISFGAGAVARDSSTGALSLYVIGGWTPSTDLATTYEYSSKGNKWVAKASMPTARDSAAAAVAGNGKVYLMGGEGRTSSATFVNGLDVDEAYQP